VQRGKHKVRSHLFQPRIKTSRLPALEKVGAVTARWRVDCVQSGAVDLASAKQENPCLLFCIVEAQKPIKSTFIMSCNLELAFNMYDTGGRQCTFLNFTSSQHPPCQSTVDKDTTVNCHGAWVHSFPKRPHTAQNNPTKITHPNRTQRGAAHTTRAATISHPRLAA
jgi:hypothetical protein